MKGADWLVAAVILGSALLGAACLRYLTLRKERAIRAKLDEFDYIAFEAEDSDLKDLQLDLSDRGWILASSMKAAETKLIYRFEKEGYKSSKLGDIVFDFEKSMPRTANRITNTIITIKEHGLRRTNAQTH